MRLQDRAADREPEPEPFAPRRPEWLEDGVEVLGRDPDPGIAHGDDDPAVVGPGGRYADASLLPRARLHGRRGVQDQIERDLLDLHLVRHRPAICPELGLDADALPTELGGKQLEDLAQRRRDVDPRAAGFVVPQQGAHRPDRVRRALVVAHDRLEDGAHLLVPDRAALQVEQPGLRVAEDRGERLVQLVRDRGGERGRARDAVSVPQLAAQLLRLLLEPRPGDGAREHLADDGEAGDHLARPGAPAAQPAERKRTDHASADAQRDREMRPQPDLPGAVGVRGGFRRQPVRQVRERDEAAGADLADQPRVYAERTARERLDAADRRRAQDVQRPVGSELGVGAAVVAERLDEPGERRLDLRDDALVGDVREAHREIGDQALESEPIQVRSIAVGALDALAVRSGRRRRSPHRCPSSRPAAACTSPRVRATRAGPREYR